MWGSSHDKNQRIGIKYILYKLAFLELIANIDDIEHHIFYLVDKN